MNATTDPDLVSLCGRMGEKFPARLPQTITITGSGLPAPGIGGKLQLLFAESSFTRVALAFLSPAPGRFVR